ncbi:MAG: hypothetical protein ACRC10_10890 [Thermoguttaceae bacterium]
MPDLMRSIFCGASGLSCAASSMQLLPFFSVKDNHQESPNDDLRLGAEQLIADAWAEVGDSFRVAVDLVKKETDIE